MNILFVCTHNACRSILCEVLARAMAQGRIHVASAGSHPAGRVHPATLDYLQRRGYDIEGLASKSWAELGDFLPDVVITVCDSAAAESCPVWLGSAVKAHWGLADPTAISGDAAATEQAFDAALQLIEARLGALLALPLESVSAAQLQSIAANAVPAQ
jgi:arsenate reductase